MRNAGERPADGLGDERYGARGARINLDHPDFAILHRQLKVHEAYDMQTLRKDFGVAPHFRNRLVRKTDRRSDRGGIPRMAARRLRIVGTLGDFTAFLPSH